MKTIFIGTIGRKTYFIGVIMTIIGLFLAVGLLTIISSLVFAAFKTSFSTNDMASFVTVTIAAFCSVAYAIAMFSLAIRRLNDLRLSGFLSLLLLVPYLNLVFVIYLCAAPGKDSAIDTPPTQKIQV